MGAQGSQTRQNAADSGQWDEKSFAQGQGALKSSRTLDRDYGAQGRQQTISAHKANENEESFSIKTGARGGASVPDSNK